MRIKFEEPRGILKSNIGKNDFSLICYLPSGEAVNYVEHYWCVEWDLRGQESQIQEVLPHPSIHLVFDRNSSGIYGIITRKFMYQLKDHGLVFGVKFHPGAFYPFYKRDISSITDKRLSLERVFGDEGKRLEDIVLFQDSIEKVIHIIEEFIDGKVINIDQNVNLARKLVTLILNDREIMKVEHVEQKSGIHKRRLQRIFSRYVGVGPKWVIKRYRIHQALEDISQRKQIDWSDIATNLGYYDQAHFIRDFKLYVGMTPEEYKRLSDK
ncbi:AraC family transcriptional regulator [Heliobacterium chlorum]|uniref:AraC family transcriptional regulator n=1 Tax=Heliobacterium chlorum TaxID=2698 RepID=A0ABR7T6F6_HELCL|nr:helix-turn-helix domain-containing protein [Heliobacterium chlorum]MBC9786350.1 AraC family transcriptional regulator [Heliobacterium chlorum]